MGSSNTGGKDDAATADGGSDSSNGAGVPDSFSCLFSEGEKVLAYHGPRIYEAKVQKAAEFRKKEWRYFVHYLGWNKNWDEWVGNDRLLKHTEENVQKQRALEKKQSMDKGSKSGRSTQAKPKSAAAAADERVDKEEAKNNAVKIKKRKSDSLVEKESISGEKLVKIQIPSVLKKQLVDDWEFVTQQEKLVKLPRSPNVDDILAKYLEYRSKKDGILALRIFELFEDRSLYYNIFAKYLEYRSKKDGMMTNSVAEILNGLRCYFDKALPSMLLYKKERQQYQEAVTDHVSPSAIYGAEHFLRLFVKLQELLAFVNIEEDALTELQQKLLDFLKFLQKNQSTFFLSAYEGTKTGDGSSKRKDD